MLAIVMLLQGGHFVGYYYVIILVMGLWKVATKDKLVVISFVHVLPPTSIVHKQVM